MSNKIDSRKAYLALLLQFLWGRSGWCYPLVFIHKRPLAISVLDRSWLFLFNIEVTWLYPGQVTWE